MDGKHYITSAYGVRMPRILYGTAWKKALTAGLVERAVRVGFRGIDTACQPKHYHEAGVGTGLAACWNVVLERPDVYLQTKFTPVAGQDPARMPYDPAAPLAVQVEQSCARSLRNLGTHYLDALVLHSPLADAEQLMEVWRAMEALFDAGTVAQLGLSNCYSLHQLDSLYRAARIKPAVLQNRFHAKTDYDRELRAYCRQHGVYYQSFWTLTANPQVLSHGTLTTLASRHLRTPAQILFRYLTAIDIVPLTGTSNETHMREDLAIFQFDLNAQECEAMAKLF